MPDEPNTAPENKLAGRDEVTHDLRFGLSETFMKWAKAALIVVAGLIPGDLARGETQTQRDDTAKTILHASNQKDGLKQEDDEKAVESKPLSVSQANGLVIERPFAGRLKENGAVDLASILSHILKRPQSETPSTEVKKDGGRSI